jgi:hypothetical protein
MKQDELRERNFILGAVAQLSNHISSVGAGLVAFLRQHIFKVEVVRQHELENTLKETQRLVKGLESATFKVSVENQNDYKEWFKRVTVHLQEVENKIYELTQVQKNSSVPATQERSTEILVKALTEIKTELLGVQKRLVFPEPPKIQQVTGKIEITNQKYADNTQIEKKIQELVDVTRKIKLEVPPYPEQKEIKLPNEFKIADFNKIERIFTEFSQKMDVFVEKIEELPSQIPLVEFPEYINIGNFPPTKTPQPVTNFNLNPLQGVAKSTRVLVTSTRVVLPDSPLENRRTVIIYNMSSVDVFIGGDDVTTTDGLPVPAGSFSPPIDAGMHMRLSAIVAAGIQEVRVLEVSGTTVGGL